MTQRKQTFVKQLILGFLILLLTSVIGSLTMSSFHASAASSKKVVLNKTSIVLHEAVTYQLQLSNAKGPVKWSSSDKTIATVSSTGKVSAKKVGTCKITAKYNDRKYICSVRVYKIALDKTSVSLVKEKTYQLKLSSSNNTVKWKSSDKSVAAVSASGKITAKKAGTCKITATYKKKDYVCTVRVYATKYDMQAESLKKQYKVSENKGKVLLAGSSSFDYWDSAPAAFAPLEIVNVGIAGTKVEHWLQMYSSLIVKYEPEAVVLYIGNDINGGANSKTGKQAYVDFCNLVTKLKKALPDTQIYYVSISPAIVRWSSWKEISRCNELMKKYCSTQKNVHYIETAKYLLTSKGVPNKKYFRSDELHLNEAGYNIFKKYIAGRVKKDLL